MTLSDIHLDILNIVSDEETWTTAEVYCSLPTKARHTYNHTFKALELLQRHNYIKRRLVRGKCNGTLLHKPNSPHSVLLANIERLK
jgi:hypothetical protein